MPVDYEKNRRVVVVDQSAGFGGGWGFGFSGGAGFFLGDFSSSGLGDGVGVDMMQCLIGCVPVMKYSV